MLPSIASLLVGLHEVSTVWISLSTLDLAMVPCDDPSVSVVREGAPVITDVEPGLGVSFGAADVGFGSSSEVQQISLVCFPILLMVASLSQEEAPALARPLCRAREDSLPTATDPVLSLASVEASAVQNP